MRGGIYKITSPSGRVYIGKTMNFKKRLGHYRRLDCKGQKMLYRSIIKYGWENHNVEIIFSTNDYCDESVSNMEIYLIKHMRTLCDYGGLNMTTGGEGGEISETTRKKMSESNKGERNGFYGKTHTEAVKDRLRELSRGKKKTEETKMRHRLAVINKETYNSRLVLDISSGIFYNSINEAARTYGLVPTTLEGWLKGKRKNKSNLRFA